MALGGGQTVIEETLLAVPHFRNALHVGRLLVLLQPIHIFLAQTRQGTYHAVPV